MKKDIETETDKKILRLKEFFNVKRDIELAKKLDIGHATIANWRKRDAMDINILLNRCPGMDWNWFLTGVTSNENKNITPNEAEKEIKILKEQNFQYATELEATEKELKKIDISIDVLKRSPLQKPIETAADVQEAIIEITLLQAENRLLKQMLLEKRTK